MKIKKIIFTLIATAVIAVSLSAVFAANDITVYVNGSSVSMDNKPQIIEGTTFVPVRVAEAMGGIVNWDSENKKVEISTSSIDIAMYIGTPYIAKRYVRNEDNHIESSGSQSQFIDCMAPRIINGSTYIPLRAMAEALDLEVEWDAETKTIYITSDKSGESSGNVIFTVDGDTLIVSGYGAMENYEMDIWNTSKFSTSILPSDVKKIIIENGITHIGECAFSEFLNLESLVIPNSVTSIGSFAFRDCYNLKTVELPSSIISIGYDAFNGCGLEDGINVDINNKEYQSIDGVLYNKDATLLICCPAHKKSITIPNSVNYIGIDAFESCIFLKNILIPNSVTRIESSAFNICESLESITIPNSVNYIDRNAFTECYSLETVYCKKGSVADDEELYSWSERDVEIIYY